FYRERGVARLRSEVQEVVEAAKTPGQDELLLIGDYRMQVAGIHNQAVQQWLDTRAYQAANLRAILRLGSGIDAETTAKGWVKDVGKTGVKAALTASQVFNPSMGKGQNRAKADAMAMGNLTEFWLAAYLKVVGLHEAVAARNLADEDLRKVYVLLPRN